MPTEQIACPECQRILRVPEDLLGQTVKCPTCLHVFTARIEAPEQPVRKDKSHQPPRAARRATDEDFAEDRSRRPRDEDDREEDERPRRRRRRYDDDEDDDWPRRPRRFRRDWMPHRGSTVMALGIVSLVVLPFILGPIAWYMGHNDLREIRAGRMDPEGEGNTNAGRICGMIATLYFFTCMLGYCGFIGLMVATEGFR